MENYLQKFEEYLDNNGYRGKYLVDNYQNPHNSADKWYRRVSVKDGDKVIQAFVLMKPSDRIRYKKYPFYRSYAHIASKYYNVLPECYIVSFEKGAWNIYNTSLPDVPKDTQSIINYNNTQRKFKKRLLRVPELKILYWSRVVCWSIAAMLIVLCSVLVLCNTLFKSILYDHILAVIGVIIVMILFPVILPLVNSITISGSGILGKFIK